MATSIFCSNTRLNSCLGRAVEAKKLKTRLDRPDRGRTVLAILRALRYAATDPEVSNLIDATMDLPPRRVSLLLHILDDAEQVA